MIQAARLVPAQLTLALHPPALPLVAPSGGVQPHRRRRLCSEGSEHRPLVSTSSASGVECPVGTPLHPWAPAITSTAADGGSVSRSASLRPSAPVASLPAEGPHGPSRRETAKLTEGVRLGCLLSSQRLQKNSGTDRASPSTSSGLSRSLHPLSLRSVRWSPAPLAQAFYSEKLEKRSGLGAREMNDSSGTTRSTF